MIVLSFVTSTIMLGCGGGGGTSNSESDIVSVTITLEKLPSTVTYNRAATPDGHVEFSWGVTFDINGDGAINQGDVNLRLMHFKAPGSIETTGPISDFAAKLSLYISNTTTQSVAVASKLISGNSITISIDKSAHSSLATISESTLVYFLTINRDDISGSGANDHYPSFRTLVNIPTNKQFVDPRGDVLSGQEIDMVSMSLVF